MPGSECVCNPEQDGCTAPSSFWWMLAVILLLHIAAPCQTPDLVPDTLRLTNRISPDSILLSATESCATSPPYRWQARPLFARFAFVVSGGTRQYRQTQKLNLHSGLWITKNDLDSNYNNNPLFRDSPVKQQRCIFTMQDSFLNANSLTIPGHHRYRNEKYWVNFLLGNFFLGEGPENIYFPPSSNPSRYLAKARIVRRALRQYNRLTDDNTDTVFVTNIRFSIPDLIETTFRPLSIKHYTGSAAISIAPLNDSLLLITVLNYTSLTSADYTTHHSRATRWPKSIPRQYQGQPMSNTCQVYHIIQPKKTPHK